MAKSDTVKRADLIQKTVAERVLQGYHRKGRIFNKTLSDGIVSVVEFQIGRKYADENYQLTVWTGLYVPILAEEAKLFPIHEYFCHVRSSVGRLQDIHDYKGYNTKFFDLREEIEPAIEEICSVLEQKWFVLEDELGSEEKILKNLYGYLYKDYANRGLVYEEGFFQRGGALVALSQKRGDRELAQYWLQKQYDDLLVSKCTPDYILRVKEFYESFAKNEGLTLKTVDYCVTDEMLEAYALEYLASGGEVIQFKEKIWVCKERYKKYKKLYDEGAKANNEILIIVDEKGKMEIKTFFPRFRRFFRN